MGLGAVGVRPSSHFPGGWLGGSDYLSEPKFLFLEKVG